MIVHSNEQPYHCCSCEFKSKWKSDVKKHQRAHSHTGPILVGKKAMQKVIETLGLGKSSMVSLYGPQIQVIDNKQCKSNEKLIDEDTLVRPSGGQKRKRDLDEYEEDEDDEEEELEEDEDDEELDEEIDEDGAGVVVVADEANNDDEEEAGLVEETAAYDDETEYMGGQAACEDDYEEHLNEEENYHHEEDEEEVEGGGGGEEEEELEIDHEEASDAAY